MAIKFRRAVSLLIAVILLVSLTPLCGGIVKVSADTFDGYTTVSKAGRYELLADQSTLALIVRDTVTGAYMESVASYDDGQTNKTWRAAMNSAVVITMISGTDDTKQAASSEDGVKRTFKKTSGGFTSDIYWSKYKFGLTLEVSLTKEGLTVRIPDASIREENSKYSIGTISVYPYLGSSYLDTKAGYMLIPDGNGALIRLDDKEKRYNAGYSAMIYGRDEGFDDRKVESLFADRYKMINPSEQVLAPIFGIAHTDDRLAFLGIVEQGDRRASVEGMPNGVSIDYNRAFVRFIERRLYTQPTSNNSTSGSLVVTEERTHSDLQIRYLFLSDSDADYAGMAGAYREYLLANGTLKTTDDGYRTRVDFLGSDREEWVIGTTAVVMTRVSDIRDIYADLKKRGVNDILSVYKGWQKGGIFNLPVSSYRTESKLGGNSELTALMKDAKAEGISFYLYDDALRINPDEHNVTFNTIKRLNKRKFEEKTYKEVYSTFYWQTPDRSAELLTTLAKKLADKNAGRLCVSGITSNLFSYTYSGTTHTRLETSEIYKQALDKASGMNELILEQPFAYLWADTAGYLDMPLYTSSYILEDEFVPFLSLVLKGVMPVYSEYVNFEANKQEFFLKLVETGTYPSFYITKESSAELIYTNSSDIYSSQYDAYAATIESYSKELKAVNDRVKGAVITGHDILGNGITRVCYSNGVKIYLNYGETKAAADGISLDPMSYVITE